MRVFNLAFVQVVLLNHRYAARFILYNNERESSVHNPFAVEGDLTSSEQFLGLK